MSNWKEKLASLNRQYREMVLESSDKSDSLTVYYRRPTELEDDILRRDMEEEFHTIKSTLKDSGDGKESMYDTLYKNFIETKIDNAIGYIVLERIPGIRKLAINEAGLEELPKDASKEDREAWLEKFKPPFDRMVEEAKDEWRDTPHEVLAARAAESRVESFARERSMETYRHCLIQQSVYGKDDDGNFERIFLESKEVPEFLDKDTIDMLANKIVEEINRYKNVPLK